jgi:hypothetical protein
MEKIEAIDMDAGWANTRNALEAFVAPNSALS